MYPIILSSCNLGAHLLSAPWFSLYIWVITYCPNSRRLSRLTVLLYSASNGDSYNGGLVASRKCA